MAKQMIMIPSEEIHSEPIPSITEPSADQDFMDPERRVGPGRPRGSKKDPDALLFNKLARAINIAFKLYATGGIGRELELLGPSGNPVQNSDLISLISYALSKGRARVGEDVFIQALADAKIPLSWITNDDIRVKLSALLSSRPVAYKRKTTSSDEAQSAKRLKPAEDIIIHENLVPPGEPAFDPANQPLPSDDDIELSQPETNSKESNFAVPGNEISSSEKEPLPLKLRLRKRSAPYHLRKPRWEIIKDE